MIMQAAGPAAWLTRTAQQALRLLSARPQADDLARSREALNLRAERLLDAHGSRILRLAYAYLHNQSDAEEVLQDTLLQFLRTAPELEGK